MDPTATPLTTAEDPAVFKKRVLTHEEQLAYVRRERDAAEDRFVRARAENDELEQELADLRAELLREKKQHQALRLATITPPGGRVVASDKDDSPTRLAIIVGAVIAGAVITLVGLWLCSR